MVVADQRRHGGDVGVSLGEPWLEDGRVYWLEARPNEQGRAVVLHADPWSSPTEVTPAGFNVRTKVHEYGGGSFAIHRGTIYFSNYADQRLYRQDPGAEPVAITPRLRWPPSVRRRQDHDDGAWWIGVRERHEGGGTPAEVVNELVASRPTAWARHGCWLGSGLLCGSSDLARWFDAVVHRLGSAVDAVGRL